MYIAYLWVDSWLKLMSACVEQMQPTVVRLGSNGSAAGDAECAKAQHEGVLEALLAAHADELGEFERRMTTHREDLVQLRAAHADELRQLRGKLADAEAAAAGGERRSAELQAKIQRQAEAEDQERVRRRAGEAAAATARRDEESAALAALEATIAGLQSELSAARADLTAVQQEAVAAGAALADARAQTETLRGAGAAAAAASAEAERLRAADAELRTQLHAALSRAEAEHRENQRLADELVSRTEVSARLAAELATARERLEAVPAASVAPAPEEAPKPSKRAPRPAAPAAAVGTAALAATEASGDVLFAERPTTARAAELAETAAAAPALSVGFRKPDGWAEPLFVHYWASAPGVAEPGWPGVAMSSAGNGWWTYRIGGTKAADLLFHDNRGNQTGDLHRERSGRLDRDGRWTDDDVSH